MHVAASLLFQWLVAGCSSSSSSSRSYALTYMHPLPPSQASGWEVELLSYAPSDLYVSSGNINGFAAFAAWQAQEHCT